MDVVNVQKWTFSNIPDEILIEILNYFDNLHDVLCLSSTNSSFRENVLKNCRIDWNFRLYNFFIMYGVKFHRRMFLPQKFNKLEERKSTSSLPTLTNQNHDNNPLMIRAPSMDYLPSFDSPHRPPKTQIHYRIRKIDPNTFFSIVRDVKSFRNVCKDLHKNEKRYKFLMKKTKFDPLYLAVIFITTAFSFFFFLFLVLRLVFGYSRLFSSQFLPDTNSSWDKIQRFCSFAFISLPFSFLGFGFMSLTFVILTICSCFGITVNIWYKLLLLNHKKRQFFWILFDPDRNIKYNIIDLGLNSLLFLFTVLFFIESVSLPIFPGLLDNIFEISSADQKDVSSIPSNSTKVYYIIWSIYSFVLFFPIFSFFVGYFCKSLFYCMNETLFQKKAWKERNKIRQKKLLVSWMKSTNKLVIREKKQPKTTEGIEKLKKHRKSVFPLGKRVSKQEVEEIKVKDVLDIGDLTEREKKALMSKEKSKLKMEFAYLEEKCKKQLENKRIIYSSFNRMLFSLFGFVFFVNLAVYFVIPNCHFVFIMFFLICEFFGLLFLCVNLVSCCCFHFFIVPSHKKKVEMQKKLKQCAETQYKEKVRRSQVLPWNSLITGNNNNNNNNNNINNVNNNNINNNPNNNNNVNNVNNNNENNNNTNHHNNNIYNRLLHYFLSSNQGSKNQDPYSLEKKGKYLHQGFVKRFSCEILERFFFSWLFFVSTIFIHLFEEIFCPDSTLLKIAVVIIACISCFALFSLYIFETLVGNFFSPFFVSNIKNKRHIEISVKTLKKNETPFPGFFGLTEKEQEDMKMEKKIFGEKEYGVFARIKLA